MLISRNKRFNNAGSEPRGSLQKVTHNSDVVSIYTATGEGTNEEVHGEIRSRQKLESGGMKSTNVI